MKIIISAGGTGGHIYPAVTLANALIKRKHEVTFIGTNDRMEKDVLPELGFRYIGLDILSTSGGIVDKVKSLVSMKHAYEQCLTLIKGYDLAIGFGNYISIPVLLAAKKQGLKTIIHEQNSLAGKANLFLDKIVDLVIGSYQDNKKQFKNPHTLILGNPQASKIKDEVKSPKVLKEMGLDPSKKTVVIFMGSLGSSTVEEKLIEMFKLMDGSYQVIYATGKEHYENVTSKISNNDWLKIYERIDGAKVMINSNLLVSRAGATTLAEICALGMPAILIPSPYVPNNHQYLNAMALVNKEAAKILEEKELTAIKLKKMIDDLINNEDELTKLSNNARKLNNENVLEDIIREIENI